MSASNSVRMCTVQPHIRQQPRRTQEQRRTETRRKLIDAAIQLLRESGFARFTIGDVASRAEVTSGAVQHHFASRQDLLLGVFEAVFPMRHAQVYDRAMIELSVSERANWIVEVYWRKIYGRSDYLTIWELIFGTRAHPDLRQRLKDSQKGIVATAVSDLTRVFADIGMSSKTALQIWTFIASQLRGLALLSMFEEQRVLRDDLTLLKEAVGQLIANRHPASPSESDKSKSRSNKVPATMAASNISRGSVNYLKAK